MNTPIFNTELLTGSQLRYISFVAKGMAEFWKSITICWYSDGSKAYIIEGIDGQIYPSVIIESEFTNLN